MRRWRGIAPAADVGPGLLQHYAPQRKIAIPARDDDDVAPSELIWTVYPTKLSGIRDNHDVVNGQGASVGLDFGLGHSVWARI